MRRASATLTSVVVLLGLAGCDSHTTQQVAATPAPTPTGNLCDRIGPNLPGNWKPEEVGLGLSAPLTDHCALIDATLPQRVWVALSVIPVTDAQAAAIRKSDEAAFSHYAAKVTDGGVGTGSWALNPVAAAPWLVFRHDNRLIRLRMENDGVGTMDDLHSIAQAIITLPGGLPSASATIARPECDRGTAAAPASPRRQDRGTARRPARRRLVLPVGYGNKLDLDQVRRRRLGRGGDLRVDEGPHRHRQGGLG